MKILPVLASIALCCNVEAMAENPDSKFLNYPVYNGDDLELTVDNVGTRWRLWSPEAEEVELYVYPTGRNSSPEKTIKMTKAENGTWAASMPEKLYGKFYTFRIKQGGKWLKETPGVWAKAVGANGERAAIIDFSKTNPSGWENDKGPAINHITDAVIY